MASRSACQGLTTCLCNMAMGYCRAHSLSQASQHPVNLNNSWCSRANDNPTCRADLNVREPNPRVGRDRAPLLCRSKQMACLTKIHRWAQTCLLGCHLAVDEGLDFHASWQGQGCSWQVQAEPACASWFSHHVKPFFPGHSVFTLGHAPCPGCINIPELRPGASPPW